MDNAVDTSRRIRSPNESGPGSASTLLSRGLADWIGVDYMDILPPPPPVTEPPMWVSA